MVRKLKHHEQKLLKKSSTPYRKPLRVLIPGSQVDFNTYKSDNDHREAAVMRRYAIQGRDDYRKYNQLAGSLRQLAHKIAALDPSDPFRRKHEDLMLEKLWDMGILGTGGGGRGKLSDIEHKVTVSAFARRRLPVVMTRLRMSDHIQAATTLIEQGHVRVGTDVITDPAYLVTRNMEDFVTWVDSSKIKRNIMKYRDKLDDFELEAV
ncbi:RpsD, Ribosomal protein S4 protein [Pyrenophora tritici-repentis]|uniref:U3 small nucleolar ribonucleoprotein protein IMP3 n=1 Tax=Pyrenophora tritici-repentis TaxID=45151 RepID=A0A922T2U5_9PLEO|nr:u3 small nucleolar ribonucleoprotein imp3 [Pyrenophora tritici-repentis]KAI1689498.1 u3 small nucleolar ribonucleoprotein imp3 [Pyrenophora tritici-repentis]PZD26917.1 RpsD, Ribosomal protein S4 protein [Pyrenophora tritici-repentis]